MKKKLVIFASLLVLVLAIQTSSVRATEVNIASVGIPSTDSYIAPLERLNDCQHPPLPYIEEPPWVFPYPTDEWSAYVWTYNFATDWGNVPRWIAYDFGTDYDIKRIVLLPYASTNGHPHYYPIDYEIQTSDDGANWKTIISVISNDYPVIDHSFPTISTRFIRIYVTRAYPFGGGFRLGATEFEVYATPSVEATVDIDPDALNLKSNGEWITAYIELPEGYDVTDIDVGTVELSTENGAVSAQLRPTEVGDHDDDGIPDLMVKFDRSAVQEILEVGDEVEITVTGEVAGTSFEGSDMIRVIEKGKSK